MLFRFIGDGDSDPDTTSLFGYEFVKDGEPVDVSGEYEVGKLRGNSHFEKVGKSKAVVASNPADMTMPQLLKFAKENGKTFKFGVTQAEILEALNVSD